MSLQNKITSHTPLHILYLEDNSEDRQLVENELARNGLSCTFLFVGNQKEFELAINRVEYDLVISDFALPSYDGQAALAATRKSQPELPFILLSGTIGEERAV